MLNTLRVEQSSVLFGTHTSLDELLRVSQLPTHLSNSTGWIKVKLDIKWIEVKFLAIFIRM